LLPVEVYHLDEIYQPDCKRYKQEVWRAEKKSSERFMFYVAHKPEGKRPNQEEEPGIEPVEFAGKDLVKYVNDLIQIRVFFVVF